MSASHLFRGSAKIKTRADPAGIKSVTVLMEQRIYNRFPTRPAQRSDFVAHEKFLPRPPSPTSRSFPTPDPTFAHESA